MRKTLPKNWYVYVCYKCTDAETLNCSEKVVYSSFDLIMFGIALCKSLIRGPFVADVTLTRNHKLMT